MSILSRFRKDKNKKNVWANLTVLLDRLLDEVNSGNLTTAVFAASGYIELPYGVKNIKDYSKTLYEYYKTIENGERLPIRLPISLEKVYIPVSFIDKDNYFLEPKEVMRDMIHIVKDLIRLYSIDSNYRHNILVLDVLLNNIEEIAKTLVNISEQYQ